MNKGDALLLELDFNVNGEALQEGEWDDIELVLGSHSYTLSNGDIYWDGETYVVFLSQEDSFKLNFTNMYQLRLLKDGFVISSKPMKMKVGGCLSRVILGDSMANLSRYNELIEGTLKTITSDAESVRDYAFHSCTQLESAIFIEAESIGQYAFGYCDNLKTVRFDKATSIGDNCFEILTESSLESVTAPLCETIGERAFEYSNISQINAPNVTWIYSYAFNECHNLTEVKFSKLRTDVQSCGRDAFSNCTSLKVVDLGYCPQVLPETFMNCESLDTLILRSETLVDIATGSVSMFNNTKFKTSGGTIYVPQNLVSSYIGNFGKWGTVYSLNENNKILPIEGSIYE